MSTASVRRGERPRQSACAPLVAARWSWLLWVVSVSVACSGSAVSDHSLSSNAGAGSSSQGDPSWCAVVAILRNKCQICHQSPTRHGAPFALVTYQDTQLRDARGEVRFEQMASAIDSEYMPPQFITLDPPVLPLTADERATLLAWCAQGAVSNEDTVCAAAR